MADSTLVSARLLLQSTVLILFASAGAAQDWVVTGTESRQDEAITLNGNLVVEATGSLTLHHVTLTFNNSSHGQYGIRVKSGGIITIESNSLLTASSNDARTYFIVEPNAALNMRSSELHRCGWATGPQDANGLQIQGNVVMEDNVLSDNAHVRISSPGEGGWIVGNRFSTDNPLNSYVALVRRSGMTIANNEFGPNPWFGITLYEANSNVISDNQFDHVTHGPVNFSRSWNNEFSRNRVVGGAGPFLLDRSGNSTIVDNSFEGAEGVTVMHCDNTTIMRNTFTRLDGWMVFLSYSSKCVVADNVSSDVRVGSGFAAIWLYHASENLIANNTVSSLVSPDWAAIGILLVSASSRNMVRGNDVGAARRGVSVHYGSNHNEITQNTFASATEEAAAIELSDSNVVHHNNFLGFVRRAFDDSAASQWDDGTEGNYWADCTPDGTPEYAIPPGAVDRHPLLAPVQVQHFPALPNPPLPIALADLPSFEVFEDLEIADQTLGPITGFAVRNGGRLILRNATLLVAGDNSSFIEVEDGATLEVYDSRIIPPTPDQGGFLFEVYPGATFVMKNSEVRGVGKWPGCSDWGALYVHASNALIEGNTISDCMCGMDLLGTEGHQVNRNTIFQSPFGIYGTGASSFVGNRVDRCLDIGIWGGVDATISGNTVSHVWGVAIASLSFSKVLANTVSDVGTGMILASVDDQGQCLVSNNVIVGARDWALKAFGYEHTIVNNTFASSSGGLAAWCSSVHHNNFVGNSPQACCDAPCSIHWDDGRTGNYWSDYRGTDANGDGTGDTPYLVSGSIQDRYPLMHPVPRPPRRQLDSLR